jgi:S-DNA-T family DNA segregation ATPase FtsK/SpoIIIE
MRGASSRAKKKKPAFLPAAVGKFLKQRSAEAFALCLIGMALFVALALLTYSPHDPSFNRAVDGNIHNLIGLPGAYAADLLLQTLGLAGVLLALGLAAWGGRLIIRRTIPLAWLRIPSLMLALLLAALTLATLPVPASWPLESGFGGFVGSLVLDTLLRALQGVGLGIGATGIGIIGGALATAAFFASLGIGIAEWRRLLTRSLQPVAAGLLAFAVLAGAHSRALGRQITALAGAITARRTHPPRQRQRSPAPSEIAARSRTAARGAKETLVAPGPRALKQGSKAEASRQASLNLIAEAGYRIPPLELLDPAPTTADSTVDEESLANNARLLETVLADFGIRGRIVKVRPGPVVTLYELEPAPGTKTARVIGLADDIARSMSALSARIAVIRGRSVIGIELPNVRREIVNLRELLASDTYERSGAELPLVLGKDIGGAPIVVDLARMPHLLIAGTTGSGKSVAINTMILSLLYRLPPEHCRLIMIDPKMLELSVYDGIPHLLAPVVTEPAKAVCALKWAVREMEERYRALSHLGVRNVANYNARLEKARKQGETLVRTVQTGFDEETGAPVYEEQALDLKPLPYVVLVVDEMADLMMTAGKDIEAAVQRLSQMARAAGIHLIMATQRPSVDVITGTIKANFPTRVSFQVTSRIDSRTILGEPGAEQLLGQGDMLYMAGGGQITRVHGPLVHDAEVEQVVKALRAQGEPVFIEEITAVPESTGGNEDPGLAGVDAKLYDEAVALVCRERKASTSFVQRHLQIGYNRAARIVEQMEANGVISPANHVGRREVLAGSTER